MGHAPLQNIYNMQTKRKTGGTQKNNLVIQQLSFSQVNRTNLDIKAWRNALQTAESEITPRRVPLYDIYFDVLLDTHLQSVIQKRKTAVLTGNIQFMRNGNIDESINKQLQSPWFRNFLSNLIDTRFWGHSVFQFYRNGEWINFDFIPRRHIEPVFGKLLTSTHDTTGIPYRDGMFKNILEVGEPRNLGLLLNASPYVIYKRNGMADYAQYAEIFGQPMREGIYDGYDEIARQKLKEDLTEMGGGGVFIHPENTQIKLIETANKSGDSKLYTDLVNLCNAEISKLILGNTLTTEQGEKGARSLGEVHQDVEDKVAHSDRMFILDTLNYDLADIFASLGVNTANGEFVFEEKTSVDLSQRVIIDMQISSKVPVDDDYWYETYDIPKPKNYKRLKAEQEEQRKALQQSFKQQPEEDKKDVENAFKRFLNFFG
jgi:hypothetical protein